MANRNFNRLQALDKEIKIIHGQFVVDSTAAAFTGNLLTQSKSVGVQSVTRQGAGHYRITLGTPGGDVDKYNHFFGAYFDIQRGTAVGSTLGGASFQVKASTVSTDGRIDFFTLKTNGSEGAPEDANTIHFMLVLKNSNLPGIGVS